MLSIARRSTRTARPSLSLARANHSLPPNNGPNATGESSTTHFGFRSVPTPEKQSLVHNVFSSVASSYDLMNDAMSLGVHRLWKDDYVSLLRPGSKGPMKCIDVAGGTGDIALRILDWSRENYGERGTSVDVVDINGGMLAEGQKRFAKTMYHATPQVSFTEADAQALNRERFPDNTYDLYTIAFGIRNVTDINAALREAQRVLKPGGVFACLEFNKVNNPLLAQLYDTYSFSVIPMLGSILAGDRESYQYLVESIRRFPPQEEFAKMIENAGFATGGHFSGDGGAWRDLWGGIACVHLGVKVQGV